MSRDADAEARTRANRAMDRYAHGEAAAFGEVYDALAPVLYGFALNLARQRASAEDLVQQTFLQLHRTRDRWIPGADVFSFARAVAYNFFIDSTRRDRRERLPDAAEEERRDLPSEEPRADDQLDVRRRVAQQLERIAHLPEKLRVAFQLVVLEGLSVAEAAEVLGISRGNVKVRVHRAREALKARTSGLPQLDT
jgi:RNA polymerase sigma-70 factor (ECF subfamily)